MKKIKKITLEIRSDLLNRIDEATIADGFNSRSEFLRFLMVTYLKKEHPNANRTKIGEVDSNEEENEFANVDCEYGIPPDVIAAIEKKARALSTNPPLSQAPSQSAQRRCKS